MATEYYSELIAATSSEAPEIREHYDSVYTAIHNCGGFIDWPYPTPEERIRDYVSAGRMFYIRARGMVAVTACLDIGPEPYPPEVWPRTAELMGAHPEAFTATPKLSISRLAAFRPDLPRGGGAIFLRAAEKWAHAQGCAVAVLNCGADNDALQTYYAQTYEPAGEVTYQSPRTLGPDGAPLVVHTVRFIKNLE